jgi:hypothetical protein
MTAYLVLSAEVVVYLFYRWDEIFEPVRYELTKDSDYGNVVPVVLCHNIQIEFLQADEDLDYAIGCRGQGPDSDIQDLHFGCAVIRLVHAMVGVCSFCYHFRVYSENDPMLANPTIRRLEVLLNSRKWNKS